MQFRKTRKFITCTLWLVYACLCFFCPVLFERNVYKSKSSKAGVLTINMINEKIFSLVALFAALLLNLVVLVFLIIKHIQCSCTHDAVPAAPSVKDCPSLSGSCLNLSCPGQYDAKCTSNGYLAITDSLCSVDR